MIVIAQVLHLPYFPHLYHANFYLPRLTKEYQKLITHTKPVYILLQTLLFRGTPALIYRASYTGALLSYSIVVFKSLGVPQANANWLRRAFVDENVQYAVLALYWWISKPVASEFIACFELGLYDWVVRVCVQD